MEYGSVISHYDSSTIIIHFFIPELKALAEVIGPYGIRFFGERLMDQVSGQVKEIKKLVINNQDTLLALHTNRDKPEIFMEVLRKLKSKKLVYCTMRKLYTISNLLYSCCISFIFICCPLC